ncbi:Alpha/Beta hydrolase protein [Chaetomium tenue]|uniref:Alpha/Beta hydrolase protein n=1 Tax=Chaetomium tenue TaxID=1854479 RepID=A0ACB7PIH6_9PEZI|nr:Alpha/Beta hydrolase protein [Chaetomium globosum]
MALSSIAGRVGLLGPWGAGDDGLVDIVFVHGLTGNREETWTHKYGVFWPRDLLAKDIPNARIWSWGYDADIFHFFHKRSKTDLNTHSNQLCTDVAAKRTQKPDRPIIFIAHSLGGLVCENAIILAKVNAAPHIKQVGSCTRGIIFLGTPLQGSPMTKWGEIGQRFARLANQDKNKELLAELKQDSPRLRELADAFSNILRDRAKGEEPIDVVCFYEQFETPPVGFVVTKDSATVGGYEGQVIPADHSDMTRFAAASDAGYVRIKGILERWIKELQASGKIVDKAGTSVVQNIDKMMGGIVVGVSYGTTTVNSNFSGAGAS